MCAIPRLFLSLFLTVLPQLSIEGGEQETQRLYPVSIVGESLVVYQATVVRPGFAVRIVQDPDPKKTDSWPEDSFVLEILASRTASRPLARMKFYSTYGFFDLSLVDLTGDGVEELLLVTGVGRGTNVREETLTVWKRDGKVFKSLLEKKVSAPCGVYCAWEYERQIVVVSQNANPHLRLIRRITGTVQSGDHAEIPKDEIIEYMYDVSSGKMIEVR